MVYVTYPNEVSKAAFSNYTLRAWEVPHIATHGEGFVDPAPWCLKVGGRWNTVVCSSLVGIPGVV